VQYLVSKDYSALSWCNYCTFLQGWSARLQGLSLNIGLKQHKGSKSNLVSLPQTVVMAASIFVKSMFICLFLAFFNFSCNFLFCLHGNREHLSETSTGENQGTWLLKSYYVHSIPTQWLTYNGSTPLVHFPEVKQLAHFHVIYT